MPIIEISQQEAIQNKELLDQNILELIKSIEEDQKEILRIRNLTELALKQSDPFNLFRTIYLNNI